VSSLQDHKAHITISGLCHVITDYDGKSKVLTAVLMEDTVYLDKACCSLTDIYMYSKKTCCLHIWDFSSTLKHSSETLVEISLLP
jgi:hypothetical protein